MKYVQEAKSILETELRTGQEAPIENGCVIGAREG